MTDHEKSVNIENLEGIIQMSEDMLKKNNNIAPELREKSKAALESSIETCKKAIVFISKMGHCDS